LTGIPLAHKDVFVTRGWKSTAASKMLLNYQSPFDAAVVERLGMPSEQNPDGAGMVCLGKANMDEFAMGSSNENSAFGPVLNPWNPACVAGGSSGGSAAAVAAARAAILRSANACRVALAAGRASVRAGAASFFVSAGAAAGAVVNCTGEVLSAGPAEAAGASVTATAVVSFVGSATLVATGSVVFARATVTGSAERIYFLA
jgi:hypothetical protein